MKKTETGQNKTPYLIGFGILGVVIALIGVEAVRGAVTPQATTRASTYEVQTAENVPTTIAASTTATNVIILDVTRHKTVSLQLAAAAATTNAGGGGLVLNIAKSVDGENWETTAAGAISNYTTVTLNINGVNTACDVADLTLGDYGYLRIVPQNTATAALASVSVKVVGKTEWSIVWPYGGR